MADFITLKFSVEEVEHLLRDFVLVPEDEAVPSVERDVLDDLLARVHSNSDCCHVDEFIDDLQREAKRTRTPRESRAPSKWELLEKVRRENTDRERIRQVLQLALLKSRSER